MFAFANGQKLKDKVTGFTGVVMCRTDYLTGCARYGLLTTKLKDGKPQKLEYFDEDVLKPVKKSKRIVIEYDKGGGPQPVDEKDIDPP